MYKTGIFYETKTTLANRKYVFVKTLKEYKEMLKTMEAPIELVGGKYQQVKPYFDVDKLVAHNEKFDKTEEIMYLVNKVVEKIHKMFPKKHIVCMKRPAKNEDGNILRTKNDKIQYSYHFIVLGVRITNKNLKKLVEQLSINDKKDDPFDMKPYNDNQGLYSIYTNKKIDKDTKKVVEVPEFIPFCYYGMQANIGNMEENIFHYWPSYIEEDYEDWDLKMVDKPAQGPSEDTQSTTSFDEVENYNSEGIDLCKLIEHLKPHRTHHYDDWTKGCWAIFNECDVQGIDEKGAISLANKFSALDEDKYKEDKSIYSKLVKLYENRRKDGNTVSVKTLLYWLKEDDPEYFRIITGAEIYFIEKNDDRSAADYFIQKYKHMLKKCDGRVFVFNHGIWVENDKQVKSILNNMVTKLNIREGGGDMSFVYSRNKTCASRCVSIVLDDDSYTDEDFIKNTFSSNLYYLAFKNGIWSFKDKKLYTYNELPNVYFTKKVNRDFNIGDKKYMIDGAEQDLQFCKKIVYDKIINPILPDKEQQKYFLMCLARALAGHYTDKKWYVAQGARDCGKGVICELLQQSFQSFVGNFKCDNFLCNRVRVSGDEAKKLSWLVPLEFCRLALGNEISIDEENQKNIKMNGILIKGIASGGDTNQARQNHKDEKDFKLQCMMFIFCNELPQVTPKDTYETLENFIFKSKFVTKEEIDMVKQLKDDNLTYFKLKDDYVKTLCANDYILDAFTAIIIDHYEQERPPMPEIMLSDTQVAKGEDKLASIEMTCTLIFEKTNDEKDMMTTEEVLDTIHEYTGNCDIHEKQVKTTLAKLQVGVHKRYTFEGKGRKMGYAYIKIRETAKEKMRKEKKTPSEETD